MFEWMHANDVAWHSYFDMLSGENDHRLTSFKLPAASVEFRRLFGEDRGRYCGPVTTRRSWPNSNLIMSTLAMLGLGAVSMGASYWRQQRSGDP
jgi:hypothetical protein